MTLAEEFGHYSPIAICVYGLHRYGDTLSVAKGGEEMHVHLAYIDASETSQSYGQSARRELQRLLPRSAYPCRRLKERVSRVVCGLAVAGGVARGTDLTGERELPPL